MKKQPRDYQRDAANALVKALRQGQTPYANLCTGSGKSLIAAMLSNWIANQNGRVIQLVPSVELCEQNFNEAVHYIDKSKEIGICCAKLGMYETDKRIVIATDTSFLNRRATSGKFDACIIDESDLVSPNEDSRLRKIFRSLGRINEKCYFPGFTGSPVRLDQGLLEDIPYQGSRFFTNCVYESDIPRLISEGYLSHVESISGDVEIDTSDLKISGTDYNTDQMNVKFDGIVHDAVKDMRLKFDAYNIETALIFATSIKNAQHILDEWGDNSTMRIAWGDMPKKDREDCVEWFKNGKEKRYLVNVGLFVRGFDYPALNAVVLFFATVSQRKYIQVCGRVIRAASEKLLGYVLDYGTNIERHGPIDATLPPKPKKRRGDAPKKLCLLCNTVNLLSAKFCKDCGAQFISGSEEGKYSMRSKAEILAAKTVEAYHEITDVMPILCHSRSNGLPMVKLKYHAGFQCVHEEYLMLDHPGGIANKYKVFLREMFKNEDDYYRMGEEGHTVENALILLENNQEYFRKVKAIVTAKTEGEKYKRLIRVDYEH